MIAVIVCSDQSQLAPESLIEHLKASIANFKVPKRSSSSINCPEIPWVKCRKMR